MNKRLFKNWWLLSLKGLLSIVFGIYLLMESVLTDKILIGKIPVFIFSIIVIISGILVIIGAGTYRHRRLFIDSIIWYVEGAFDIFTGGVLLFFIVKFYSASHAITSIFHYFIIFWITIMGILQVINSLLLKRLLRTWWIILCTGTISIILSFIFLGFLDNTQHIIKIKNISVFIILFGIFLIIISYGVKNIFKK